MKKMKKLLVAALGVLMTFSLAACSKTVATTSGGKITESEYYDQMKQTQSGKQVLQQMILDKVLEKDYGSKVSKKEVNKQYNELKSQYGSSFSSALEQNGLTPSSLKKQIRSNLLLRQAVIANTKITNKMLKEQWKAYEPKITVAYIVVSKESEAQDVINQLKEDGSYSNFKKLAKKYSTDESTKDNGGKLPSFDNTDTQLDSAFKKAAFKLKTGQFTETPVKVDDTYQVIYCIKNPGKGKMKDHTKELKNQIIDEEMNNSTTLQNVISKVLKNGDVSIKDKDLQNILANYTSTSSTTTDTTTENSSTESSATSQSSNASSVAESSSTN